MSDAQCKIKVRDDEKNEWGAWIPGKILASENVPYPKLPWGCIHLVEYPDDGSSTTNRGWFNPALGIVWMKGEPEPTLTYRESVAIYRSFTNVLVAINSPAAISGRQGWFPVWHKAVVGPIGMGESQLTRHVKVEEGHAQGQIFADPAVLMGLVPNEHDVITGLLESASIFQPAFAQAPVNDVISWPSGLLLLASVLYAALGTNCDVLWEIDPSIGPFIWTGLPFFSLPVMQRVNWVADFCHFVPHIRTAVGKSNFWYRSDEISQITRTDALRKVLEVLRPVTYIPLPVDLNNSLWSPTPEGLLRSSITSSVPPPTPDLKPPSTTPTARDFLLFAAHHYHVFWQYEVNIYRQEKLVFSTRGLPPSAILDVDSEEDALYITAAHMVARPHSQSIIRSLAKTDESTPTHFHLDLDKVDLTVLACSIDFHSYSPDKNKVAASLTELAAAYFRVAQYMKHSLEPAEPGSLAQAHVGQSIWISIFGGVLFDDGRLTIQYLPGRWGCRDASVDEAYLGRLERILENIAPYANTSDFEDLVFSGGTSRRATYPFLFAGLCGQMIICYFLSVGTSAGVWTAVALSNSLYAGRLTDLHSLFNGKAEHTTEPGMKMYVPRSPTKDIMVVATFDRSAPRTRGLRPGLLLNLLGVTAAIFGAIFQDQTRTALEFGSSPSATPAWVVYTSVALALGTSGLLLITVLLQQTKERTWRDDSEVAQRWMVYTTIIGSVAVSGLAVFFMRCKEARLWPILDAITYLSAIPLGLLENGRMISADDNMLHLALLTRWVMGAVASSVGSSNASGSGVCWK
ncbi:hypothetical protein EIP91_003776 [Steccherinum ochraceum]|uniref:Uncharacterized protein n=1 Tax=Steccherinum ochraceum TaxID=92696 RepID=A0A4R0RBE3_9APHY|nr:hypothetical protein EIP91_003776 [Steccherinum ochraceum]